MPHALRITDVNDAPIRGDGDYVLYWMIAARRARYNHALDRAVDLASELGRPLVVFEPLRSGYRWASDRIHRVVLDGMADNRRAFAQGPATYYPWVERAPDAGEGLLAALASRACVVVTDEFPCFFLPRMVEAAGAALDVKLEQVDGNGLLPLRQPERTFSRAHSYRRHVQKVVKLFIDDFPAADPFGAVDLPGLEALPEAVTSRWPPAGDDLLEDRSAAALADLPIDHSVPPVEAPGGSAEGRRRLARFIAEGLAGYADGRNHPDSDGSSGLSPYLHFGHVGLHEVLDAVFAAEGWNPQDMADKATGKREGFWGASKGAESFIDEVVTWREVGYQFCFSHPDTYDTYGALPDWARETLADHEDDERPWLYTLEALEAAETHDEIWNAAQRQLRQEGVIHNYLRMLWGKKVLHWSPSPQEAFERLVHLNNKYAVDGRDPNSYTGILWTLGHFDRAWGPERDVFGKVRYMTSRSTRRKLRLKGYLERYGPA